MYFCRFVCLCGGGIIHWIIIILNDEIIISFSLSAKFSLNFSEFTLLVRIDWIDYVVSILMMIDNLNAMFTTICFEWKRFQDVVFQLNWIEPTPYLSHIVSFRNIVVLLHCRYCAEHSMHLLCICAVPSKYQYTWWLGSFTFQCSMFVCTAIRRKSQNVDSFSIHGIRLHAIIC